MTGGQAANTVALAAARHHVLAEAGWDVERDGCSAAPPVRVVANGERHATIDRALRLLGLGAGALEPVATDAQGAIDVADLARVLASRAGRADHRVPPGRQREQRRLRRPRGGVRRRPTTTGPGSTSTAPSGCGPRPARPPATWSPGSRRADSWATDGHKWLNVPYDCGYAFCAHPDAHAAAMSYTAAYLTGQGQGGLRAPGDYVLESSRRARGFATWAALRQLGPHRRRRAGRAVLRPGPPLRRRSSPTSTAITIANDVVLNQVLVRLRRRRRAPTGSSTPCSAPASAGWAPPPGTAMRLMRISVSSWRTTEADVDRSVAAILAAWSKGSPD